MSRRRGVSVVLALLVAGAVGAQVPPPPTGRAASPPARQRAAQIGAGAQLGRRGGVGGRGRIAVDPAQARQIQMAFGLAMRNQLGLTAEQEVKVRSIDSSFAIQRTALERDEVRVRNQLRRALQDTTVDKAVVARLWERLNFGLPQAELRLRRQEQQALSAVLNPVQIAKFGSLREQLRARLEAGPVQAAPVPGAARRGRGGA